MEARYHPHARLRMIERHVTEADVEGVLRDYETELPAKHGRRNRYRTIAGRRIRVTFDKVSGDGYFVWTVTSDEVSPQE
jgi:hypothetical protein